MESIGSLDAATRTLLDGTRSMDDHDTPPPEASWESLGDIDVTTASLLDGMNTTTPPVAASAAPPTQAVVEGEQTREQQQQEDTGHGVSSSSTYWSDWGEAWSPTTPGESSIETSPSSRKEERNTKRKREGDTYSDPEEVEMADTNQRRKKKRKVTENTTGPTNTVAGACSAIQTVRSAPTTTIDQHPIQIRMERADPPGPRTFDAMEKEKGRGKGNKERDLDSATQSEGNSTQLNRCSEGMIAREAELELASMLDRCCSLWD